MNTSKTFPTLPQRIFPYTAGHTEEIILPYSAANLDRLHFIMGFPSPYFQEIAAYYHNSFEIHVLLESFPVHPHIPSPSLSKAKLSPDQVEKLFVQFISLYEAAVAMKLDFIDFTNFHLEPCFDPGSGMEMDGTLMPRFPLLLTKPKEPSLSSIMNHFRAYEAFKNLDERDYKKTFAAMSSRCKFEERLCHMYRLADFHIAVMDAYTRGSIGNSRDVKAKIKIEALSSHLEPIIQKHLHRKLVQSDTCFIYYDRQQTLDLPAVMASLLPADARREAGITGSPGIPGKAGKTAVKDTPADNGAARTGSSIDSIGSAAYVKIVKALQFFFKKSAFRSLVLFVDELKTPADNEFLQLFFDTLAPDLAAILVVVFSSEDTVDFDLRFKENPRNLLAKYLKFFDIEEVAELTQQEKNFLKVFKAIPLSLSRHALERFFTNEECRIVDHLVRKKYLKSIPGKIMLNESYPGLNIHITGPEIKTIRQRYLDKFDSINVLARAFIETGNSPALDKQFKKFLEDRIKKGDGHVSMQRVFIENLDFLSGKTEFLKLFAELFIKEGDFATARQALQHCTGEKELTLFVDLKCAHIHRLEGNYAEMSRSLDTVASAGFMPPPLLDEYHYLRYVEAVEVSGYREAAGFLKKIASRFYLNRAKIVLAQGHRHRGEYSKARQMLKECAGYFDEEGFHRDKLRSQCQLAQVMTEEHEYEAADNLFKTILIECEMKPYPLLLGYLVLGHGDLYLVQGEFSQARSCFKKAMQIFTQQGNPNGEMQAGARQAIVDLIDGNWLEATATLKSILQGDRQDNRGDAQAYDHYYIAVLECMKYNTAKALEFIESAAALFDKRENIPGAADADFLKYRILSLAGNPRPGMAFFKTTTCAGKLTGDRAIVNSLLRMLEENKYQPADPNAGSGSDDSEGETQQRVENIEALLEKLEALKSPVLVFDLLVLLIAKYRHPLLLDRLRSQSMELSKGTRNYFFYEYYYIYYRYFLTSDLPRQEEQDIFLDTYTFFSRNKRRISPRLNKMKQSFDEQESYEDIFNSARMVEDYRTWKLPGDFFKDFVKETRRLVQPDLVQLVVFPKEKGKGKGKGKDNQNENGKENAAIFDFSTENTYRQVTRELVDVALSQSASLDLTLDETREICRSQEKVFYNFANTKVVLWPISANLFGVLVLAFMDAAYYNYDFERRGRDLLKKFAQLFIRFYEADTKIDRQLEFLIGDSLSMSRVKEQIMKVGKVDFPVLISGESGTGKELIAQAIHLVSSRSAKPFIPVNSAAIPENLLEAELFGYRKGAFTGANENRTGLIEAADLGTLFLDEIGDLPMGLQAKLLRALQEGEIRRLGENRTVKVDFRLISATNKDLKSMAHENRFREDLYYRIEVLQIKVPPLRDRLEDIPLLTRHFLEKNHFPVKDIVEFQGIVEYLKSRDWPGNVRELESSIKRMITYYPDFEIGETVGYEEDFSLKKAKDNLEKILILRILRKNHWNKVKTMKDLGISRMYLFNLMQKYDIPPQPPDTYREYTLE